MMVLLCAELNLSGTVMLISFKSSTARLATWVAQKLELTHRPTGVDDHELVRPHLAPVSRVVAEVRWRHDPRHVPLSIEVKAFQLVGAGLDVRHVTRVTRGAARSAQGDVWGPARLAFVARRATPLIHCNN